MNDISLKTLALQKNECLIQYFFFLENAVQSDKKMSLIVSCNTFLVFSNSKPLIGLGMCCHLSSFDNSDFSLIHVPIRVYSNNCFLINMIFRKFSNRKKSKFQFKTSYHFSLSSPPSARDFSCILLVNRTLCVFFSFYISVCI